MKTGGVLTGAAQPAGGQALLAFLTNPAAAELLRARGYDPLGR